MRSCPGVLPLFLGVLLAGCSTLPTPFSVDEQKQIAANDRKAATADVEPLAEPAQHHSSHGRVSQHILEPEPENRATELA